MIYNGAYLRVRTPRTTNGSSPIIINGEQKYKEVHLPVTALPRLEENNKSLPPHLKKIIEMVQPAPAQPAAGPEVTTAQPVAPNATAPVKPSAPVIKPTVK